jgi:hypothetical protein
MNYSSWTWADNATTEQCEDLANKIAIDRLCAEASRIFEDIPEVPSVRGEDHAAAAEEARWESLMERLESDLRDVEDEEGVALTKDQFFEICSRAENAADQERDNQRRMAFATLDAIEDLMAARGARFKRSYEHWNEDERRMEYLERNRDNDA